MTNIATKNGSIIVKDGSAAERCECCNDICASNPSYLHMSATGLPNAITGGLSLGYAARSPYEDNGAEFTLYKMTVPRYGTTQYCRWSGGPHGFINRIGWTSEQQAGWILDAAQNKLYGYGRRFSPPEGATFRSLPYSDQRPLQVDTGYAALYANDFGANADWSNVVVTIGTDKTSSSSCFCGGGFNFESGNICSPADLSGGSAWTPCAPSSGNYCVDDVADLSLTVSVTGKITQITQSGINGVFDTIQLNPGIDLSVFSGDYDASWEEDSRIAFGSPFAPLNQFAAPQGAQWVSQGYRFRGSTATAITIPAFSFAGTWNGVVRTLGAGCVIAVRPTAFEWSSDSPGGEASLSRCQDGQVSWGVHYIPCLNNLQNNPASPIGAFYKAVPCLAYQCGGPPSFSVSGTIPVAFGVGSPGDSSSTMASGTVDVTISTS